MEKNFSIIVALDEKRGIGKEGILPWHLPEDLKHFKSITTQTTDQNKKNVVVMGRKTWESIPEKFRPLPNRVNVVLTKNTDYKLPEGVFQVSNFDDIFNLFEGGDVDLIDQVFIIGGQQIFELAFSSPLCTHLYLTHIKGDYKCDTFLPDYTKNFTSLSKIPEVLISSDISFYFMEYQISA
jgi:dihydrofolate reductase/thymidylate synthase